MVENVSTAVADSRSKRARAPAPGDGESLREKILDILCEDGSDRRAMLTETRLASMIDSLKIVELFEVLEDSTGRRVPDDEITEENFSSVSAICTMASRLSERRP